MRKMIATNNSFVVVMKSSQLPTVFDVTSKRINKDLQMGYKVSEIKIYKEDDFNTAPASPKISIIKNTSFDLKEEQRSKKNELLGNGHEPSATTYGGYDYSGSIGFSLSAEYLALLCDGVIGSATTVSNAVTTTREASKPYTVGDIVNHSNGSNSLVCYKAGTSGSTSPSVTSKANGSKITDGSVTWILRPLLKKRVGTLQSCLPSYAIERQDSASCTVAETHYEKFSGLIMESLELKKEGSEITFDVSQNLKGLDYDGSFKNSSYSQMGAGLVVEENFYSSDDLTIETSTDGSTWTKLSGLDNISLSVQRSVEIEDVIDGKRPKFKETTISGSASGLMSKDLYLKSYEKQTVQMRFVYKKANGDKSTIAFSAIEFGTSSKNITLGEDILIDIALNGSGTTNVSAISYECISALDL